VLAHRSSLDRCTSRFRRHSPRKVIAAASACIQSPPTRSFDRGFPDRIAETVDAERSDPDVRLRAEAVRRLRQWAWGMRLILVLLLVVTLDMVAKPGL
jgi:hypothetical protein